MANITFLVEDDRAIRESLIPTLELLAEARIVGMAETENDATTWLTSHHEWNLAVVDLFLKRGTGMGILKACQGRQPHQRMVILTNYATAEMRRQCQLAGADAMFDKASEIEALIDYCCEITPDRPGRAAMRSA